MFLETPHESAAFFLVYFAKAEHEKANILYNFHHSFFV
jgi:hypothetical protein